MNETSLSDKKIRAALQKLSDALGENNTRGELCLFGGTVMVLAYAARISTRDVDAIFQPTQLIRQLAKDLSANCELPEDWLNDGVKGFVSAKHETTPGNLPQFPNLRLTMPTAEYLLAMKCMASRIDTQGSSDVADIIFLVKHLALKSADQVLAIVAEYYPPSQIPVKAQFLVQGIFEEGKV